MVCAVCMCCSPLRLSLVAVMRYLQLWEHMLKGLSHFIGLTNDVVGTPREAVACIACQVNGKLIVEGFNVCTHTHHTTTGISYEVICVCL